METNVDAKSDDTPQTEIGVFDCFLKVKLGIGLIFVTSHGHLPESDHLETTKTSGIAIRHAVLHCQRQ